jgi:preprotein translocase subunit Sec63
MSSFNNEYKREKEDKKEDNSYYTFLAGILIIFVIRYFIIIIKRIFYKIPYDNENKYINCHCSKCKERYKNYRLKIKSKNINKTLFYYICSFIITILLFIECCKNAKNSDNKRFDPFEILEISEFSSPLEIKKAYKALSL